MAASVNVIYLIGRIGQEPESIQMGTDTLARFSLATDDGYRGADGQRVERTTWHSISCRGKTAAFVLKYLHKGNLVMASGRMLSRKYQTKDGRNGLAWYVQAERVLGLDKKEDAGQALAQSMGQPRQQPQHQDYTPADGGAYGDDWKY